MTTSAWQKFKAAIDSVGIKKFQIDTDTDYHLFNDTDAAKVIVFDEGSETFYNFRQRVGNGSDGWKDPVIVTACEVADIHMIKFGATPDKISKFIEQMGLNLDEEQQKAVIKINKGNYDINPETGDYKLAGFRVLSDEEIAELTPQEKIDYEKKLEIFNNRKKMGNNQVVQITY
jgi:hypothetical protein